MKLISVADIRALIKKIGHAAFSTTLDNELETQFKRWHEFNLSPRHATRYPFGVIELMPCSDQQYYTFKYVNGHPNNPTNNKLCVVAIGVLADTQSGYPLMICEMTLLTAFRAVLAAKYLAKPKSSILSIIGSGAQSEFLAKAFAAQFPISVINYFDVDPQAMDKFHRNMKDNNIALHSCSSIDEAIQQTDIIITATAAQKRQSLLRTEQIKPGVFIHAWSRQNRVKHRYLSQM